MPFIFQLKNKQSDLSSAILSDIGVQSIVTCPVAHCPNAFGVTVCLDHDHRVTYSGDTIPCDELVVIGESLFAFFILRLILHPVYSRGGKRNPVLKHIGPNALPT